MSLVDVILAGHNVVSSFGAWDFTAGCPTGHGPGKGDEVPWGRGGGDLVGQGGDSMVEGRRDEGISYIQFCSNLGSNFIVEARGDFPGRGKSSFFGGDLNGEARPFRTETFRVTSSRYGK